MEGCTGSFDDGAADPRVRFCFGEGALILAEHDSWLLILLCLPSKFQQLGYGGPISFGECWAHIPSLPTLPIMWNYLCAPI
jgi:hypothetical protein